MVTVGDSEALVVLTEQQPFVGCLAPSSYGVQGGEILSFPLLLGHV